MSPPDRRTGRGGGDLLLAEVGPEDGDAGGYRATIVARRAVGKRIDKLPIEENRGSRVVSMQEGTTP